MAAATHDDKRTLPVARSDGVVVSHILVSTAFLVVGGGLYALSLAALSFSDLLSGPLGYGRLRPAALVATVVGWLVISLTGGAYYVLPRLTGTRLWGEDLAGPVMWATALVAAGGTAVVLLGLGDGVQPLSLPWWLDLPLVVLLAFPAVAAVQTVRRRTEEGAFVTLWFVLAGVGALPLVYLAGNLPNLAAIGRELGAVTFTAGFTTLWVTMMGVGLAYYAVVKACDEPLANRQMARVGFWSLVFAASWAGPARLSFGPAPDWLDAVAAAMTLALPVAAIANAAGLAASMGKGWSRLDDQPELRATVAGAALMTAVALATALGGFRSAAALVGFTPYWEGVVYAGLFGVGGLLVAAWTHQALPAVSGRRPDSPLRALQHVRLTTWGVGGTALLLAAAGVMAGFGWTGGAFTQVTAVGEGWSQVRGTVDVVVGLAVVTAIVAFLGQLAFASAVFRTLTSGRATTQEVLVATEDADE